MWRCLHCDYTTEGEDEEVELHEQETGHYMQHDDTED
jgi:hypothetical protein